MKIIDLFAGSGGFSKGFNNAGFTTVAACEINPDMAKTFEKNHNTIVHVGDIKDFSAKKYNNEVTGVIGGPPCQGFSLAGNRNRSEKEFIEDPRNFLFKEYVRVLNEVKPDFFVMENVPGMLTMKNGEIFREVLNSLKMLKVNKKKYHISYAVLNAADYGVPQNRKRLIILGTLNKTDINNIPIHKEQSSVWDAIEDLSKVNYGDKVRKNTKAQSPLSKILSDSKYIYNHTPTNHSAKSITRMKQVNEGSKLVDESIKSIHSGAYGRLSRNQKSVTITTRFDTPSAGRYIHPIHNRTITPREGARLQTFPDTYRFFGSKTNIYTMIGNAVPVMFAESIANFIKNSKNNI